MNAELLAICSDALRIALVLSLPALAAALIVGLVVGILQSAFQIQEQTLSYLFKVAAVTLILLATAGNFGRLVERAEKRWLNPTQIAALLDRLQDRSR